MNKVTLHGVEYNLPCHVVSLGLDMQCHHVVTQSTILSVNAAEDKVIIESEGIKIRLRMNDLNDFYPDTTENYNILKSQCDEEYSQWYNRIVNNS
jgi:hypothetical protein